MQNIEHIAALAAIEWHLDHGADEAFEELPVKDRSMKPLIMDAAPQEEKQSGQSAPHNEDEASISIAGSQQFKEQAVQLISEVKNIDQLSDIIKNFNGLDIKKTAMNFVFSDGDACAKIMIIGDAPGGDDDRAGLPFSGENGRLLDKILSCVQLSRNADAPEKAVYLSNILNWRPPGNRTPTPQEIDISLPFIEKHIALINPDILILCGGVTAQALLYSKNSISKLRGTVHSYVPQTLNEKKSIPAIVTYHPSNLISVPSQKARVWQDILRLHQHLEAC